MGALKLGLLVAALLGCSWYVVLWALRRQKHLNDRWPPEVRRKAAQRNSDVDGRKGDVASIALVVVMTALLGVVLFVGLTGRPLPEWFLWAATVL